MEQRLTRTLILELEFSSEIFPGLHDGQELDNVALVDYLMAAIDSLRRTKVRFGTRLQEELHELINDKKWSAVFEWTQRVRKLNEEIFCNPSFRLHQEEIINAILAGKDVFACMPTGSGKSLLFQLPILVGDKSRGVSLIVLPLVALIADQKRQFDLYEIEARLLNSNHSTLKKLAKEIRANRSSQNPVLLASPEIVDSPKVFEFLSDLHSDGLLDRIYFDEAHCVIEWGQTFRQTYMNLRRLRSGVLDVKQIIMLTGSAPPLLRKTLISSMRLKDPAVFVRSHDRANLFLQVIPSQNTEKDIQSVLKVLCEIYPGKSGIIYCRTKSNCEDLLSKLRDKGSNSAAVFTGDLSVKQKNELLTKWLSGEVLVMIATVAFGMGINKPDCRFVIHYDTPSSMEGYYQGIGRAGRDGFDSLCLSFFSPNDIRTQDNLMRDNPKGVSKYMHFYLYCLDTHRCRRQMLLSYFEKTEAKECQMCDNCVYRSHMQDDPKAAEQEKKKKGKGKAAAGALDKYFLKDDKYLKMQDRFTYDLTAMITELRERLELLGYSNDVLEEVPGFKRRKKKGADKGSKKKPLTALRLVESLLGRKDSLVKELKDLIPEELAASVREILAFSLVGIMLRDGMLINKWVSSKKRFGYMVCFLAKDTDLDPTTAASPEGHSITIGWGLKERGIDSMQRILCGKPKSREQKLTEDLILQRSKLFFKYQQENKRLEKKASSSSHQDTDVPDEPLHSTVDQFMPTQVPDDHADTQRSLGPETQVRR